MNIPPSRERRLPRRALATGVVVVLAGTAAYAFLRPGQPPAGDSAPAEPTRTVAVARGTVTERAQFAGAFGYDGSYSVVHQGPAGVLTAIADVHSTVDRGGSLYSVANEPVRLLFGATPAYRDLRTGISDGPDVADLERNLVALGLDPDGRITVDSWFTDATAVAIRRWQTATGVPTSRRTGALKLGQVVFRPGAVRVAAHQASPGITVGPDVPVLSATSTAAIVTAQVTPDRRAMLEIGTPVTVSMSPAGGGSGSGSGSRSDPKGQSMAGSVARVEPVSGNPDSAGERDGADAGQAAMLRVVVSLSVAVDDDNLAGRPVQVSVTTRTHTDVLLVPVTALLARPGGGYQLRLSTGELVAVQTGLFDESAAAVEVSGPGLAAGMRVEAPA